MLNFARTWARPASGTQTREEKAWGTHGGESMARAVGPAKAERVSKGDKFPNHHLHVVEPVC